MMMMADIFMVMALKEGGDIGQELLKAAKCRVVAAAWWWQSRSTMTTTTTMMTMAGSAW